MQTPLTFLAAFIVVLALIGLTAWLVRRFSGGNLGNAARGGRMPRLAVIDAAAVDGRRRLVLVRRDNVEHLLMIGGPTDVVVELNIVRAMPARDGAPARPGDLPRAPSIADGMAWTDGGNPDDLGAPEPAPEPAPARRGGGASFADEVRRPVPQGERRNFDAAALAPDTPPSRPELAARTETRELPAMPPRPPRPPRPEGRAPRLAETLARLPRGPDAPPAAPPVSASAPSAPSVDEKELSDMAQRLEAALRRPSAAPPVVAPSAEPVSTASAPAVEAPRPPRPTSSAPPVAPPDGPSPKAGFENLEDEMASLLGRPKSP